MLEKIISLQSVWSVWMITSLTLCTIDDNCQPQTHFWSMKASHTRLWEWEYVYIRTSRHTHIMTCKILPASKCQKREWMRCVKWVERRWECQLEWEIFQSIKPSHKAWTRLSLYTERQMYTSTEAAVISLHLHLLYMLHLGRQQYNRPTNYPKDRFQGSRLV